MLMFFFFFGGKFGNALGKKQDLLEVFLLRHHLLNLPLLAKHQIITTYTNSFSHKYSLHEQGKSNLLV